MSGFRCWFPSRATPCFSEQVTPFQISPEDSVGVLDYFESPNPDMREIAVRKILALEHNNLFEQAYRDLTKRAIEDDRGLLSVRETLGIKRQIFYCSMDGFDTQGAQFDAHWTLLREVSQAMASFYAATVELGIKLQVTTFTTSEFGRT